MGEVETIDTGRSFSLTPKNLEQAMEYARIIAESDIVPKEYQRKPGNVLVAVQMGAELGLPPLQALQNIAVINGRPAVWGDSLIAIARAHPACEFINESFDDRSMTATCRVKRRGEPEQIRTFSQKDAELAGLWGKQGPWTTAPKRMLQMRARGFAIRDVFADALRGLSLAEEVQDIQERDITPPTRDEIPPYPAELFETNLPKWAEVMQAGKKSADDIIAMVQTKGTLTDEQKKQIRDAEVADADFTEGENDEDA